MSPTSAKVKVIVSFTRASCFLSNFHSAVVTYDGIAYPTVEHAYQAAKCVDPEQRKGFNWHISAWKAKRLGRKVKIRPDWEAVKSTIMLELLRQKFSKGPFKGWLLSTIGYELVEGNDWHDTYWGVCDGTCTLGPHTPYGQNLLGKLLMQVRTELTGDDHGGEGTDPKAAA